MTRNRLVLIAAAGIALFVVASFPSLKRFVAPYGTTALAIDAAPMPAVEELTLEETIPLGDVKGRLDHMAVDVRRGRLFIAELGNGSVAVVDLGSRKLARRITGLKEPQGVAYAREPDRLFIANGGTGTIEMREGDELTGVGEIALGDDADNIRLDDQNRVIVGYGDGALAVLDSTTGGKIVDIPLAAHPEAFLPEPGGNRIFVNEPGALRIAVIDRPSGKQIARWGVAGALANFPMALDAAGRRLFVVYRTPALIGTFDTQNGDLLGQLPTCRDADDVFHDASRNRVYVICGEGAIAVLDASGRSPREQSRIQTRPGARTGLFVPALDRLYVAVPAHSNGPAEIRAYRPH